MGAWEYGVRYLAENLNKLGGLLLLGMVLLTCADIVLRTFGHPIPGTYELVGVLSALVAALALADSALKRGHVAVEFLVARLSETVNYVLGLLTNLCSLALFGLIAWQCFVLGQKFRDVGEVSATMEFPYCVVLYVLAMAAAVVSLVLATDVINVGMKRTPPWSYWK